MVLAQNNDPPIGMFIVILNGDETVIIKNPA